MNFDFTPEQIQLRDAARKLATEKFKDKAAYWDDHCEFPEENKEILKSLGYLGLSVDEKYGGSGLGLVDTYLVVEEISKVDMLTALIVHDQNVSPRIIANYAPDALKQRLIPAFVKGELECSIAWTEPQAGSDATAVTTTAVRDGDDYIINGQKVFTTFGDRVDMHLVYARFGGGKGARGIGTIIVERDRPGVKVYPLEKKMGVRGANENQLFFDNVRVPASNVVTQGDPSSSKGFVQPLTVYNATRVGMGVMAMGVAEGAFDLAREYMTVREQFGQKLCEMQGLRWMMSDMLIDIEAARCLCYKALAAVDAGKPDPCLSSIAKVFATEMAQKVVYNCQQMFGGYGYFGTLPLERMLRDVRMLTITGGTTQTQKNVIANHIFPNK
ncbi:MAG: acyl-CoA dehydrogenase [Betaproteobacteria bacterium]|nr:acyl-CoA dehydrogenase family protein [Rhodocyclaceae bacterium]MCG3187653.1 Acyl-CoA dehydrogenase, short-chain specific [Rhodocyclaceae bacterium]